MKLFRTVTVLLLMGALALLIAGCQKGSERAEVSAEKKAETSGEVKDPAAEVKNEIRQNLSETAEAVKEGASEAAKKIGEGVSETAESIKQGAEEIRDRASETAKSIKQDASETAKSIKEGAVEAKEEIKEKSLETVEAITAKTAETAKGLKEGITPSPAAGYVGAKKCKTCHIKQYKSWSNTAMAGSFENLKPGVRVEAKKLAGLEPDKDYTVDPECVRCHSTGYGEGGFISMEETPDLAGVQCEACHGPGSEYSLLMKKNKEFALKDARAEGLIIPSENEKGCLQCHGGDSPFNENLDPKYKFNFKERLKKTHTHFPLRYKH